MPAEENVAELVAGVGGGDDDRVELGELRRKGWIRNIAVAADLGENLNGLVSPTIGDQPTRALWEKRNGEEKHDYGYDLEGKWEAPLEVRGDIAKSVAKPVGEDNTDVIGTEDEGESRASIVCSGKFRYPSWNDLGNSQVEAQK